MTPSTVDGERLLAEDRLPCRDAGQDVRLVRRPAAAPDEVTWDPTAGTVDLDALAGIMNGTVEVKAGLDALQETVKPILAQENAK